MTQELLSDLARVKRRIWTLSRFRRFAMKPLRVFTLRASIGGREPDPFGLNAAFERRKQARLSNETIVSEHVRRRR